MLFNEDVLFLHAPKTAGTSVTSFLISALPGPIVLTEPSDRPNPSVALSAADRARLLLRRLRHRAGMLARPSVKVAKGVRHETLSEARETLRGFGKRPENFRLILSIVRNPYDLEVSRYHFFRRGYQGIAGAAHEYAEELALAGDFPAFARHAPYHGRLPSGIEDWYELEGRIPENVRLIRFENLENELTRALSPLYPIVVHLPKLNRSEHAPYESYLTVETERAIYEKFRWPFDKGLYQRHRFQS